METQNPKSLFENCKENTRVLITGDVQNIAKLVIHTLDFFSKETDYVLQNGETKLDGHDFLLLEHHDITSAGNFQANIVLVASDHSVEQYENLISSIVPGGILVYSEENEILKSALLSANNYFRKIPYTKPKINGNQLDTEIGKIPVSNIEAAIIPHLEGTRLLCQQLQIMEEDFYEALMSFN